MTGTIENVSMGREALHVLRNYLDKFPFCAEFFSLGQPLEPERFLKKFKVKLYKLTPESVYYLDNRIRFGFRELVVIAGKR